MSSPRIHRPQEVLEKFKLRFGQDGTLYRAPGRVNLIGEHTDYNDGFVLPAAINFSCWVAASRRDDQTLVVHSENFSETLQVKLGDSQNWPRKGWIAYPLGVAWMLEQEGLLAEGANLYIAGDVPLGSGLSSSAAIEVSTGSALLHTFGESIELTQLALLCQKAENDFVGARCGIMDQFIACHGKAGHAVLLDCRSLEGRLIPIPPNVALVVCNTMVKHELAANEYNKRREECEEGVQLLKRVLPGIEALRDVHIEELDEHRALLPSLIYRRCRHIVTENERTLLAANALQRGELGSLSKWMAESHESLRVDFEVSCRELDIMVEIAATQPGVLGARMTGGGFGGCTINLVEQNSVPAFLHAVESEYFKRTNLKPEILSMQADDGAGQVK